MRNQGTCTSLLSRSDGTLNRGLSWLHMHSIWSKLKDPGTQGSSLPYHFALQESQLQNRYQACTYRKCIGIKVGKEKKETRTIQRTQTPPRL